MIIINVKNSCAVFSLKNRKLKRDFEIFLKEIFCPIKNAFTVLLINLMHSCSIFKKNHVLSRQLCSNFLSNVHHVNLLLAMIRMCYGLLISVGILIYTMQCTANDITIFWPIKSTQWLCV